MKTRAKTAGVLRRQRRSKGSAMVESALIFMVFSAMLIGAFDFGQFLFVQQALVERARYAARWGSVNDPTDSTSIQNMVLYNQSTAGTSSYFGLSASNVSVSTSGSGTDNYLLTVQISGYSITTLSPYLSPNQTGAAVTVAVPLGLYN